MDDKILSEMQIVSKLTNELCEQLKFMREMIKNIWREEH